jgi:hypothetical protein
VPGAATQDLNLRIISTQEGEGFKKTSEEAWAAADELDKLLKKIEAVDAERPEVKVKADTGEAKTKLEEVKRSADDAGSAGGSSIGLDLMKSRFLGLAGAAGVVGPALAAVPAALAGLAAAGGTLALGLGGVISALHAFGQESSGAGVSSAQLAATAFSNAQALDERLILIRGASEQ